MVSNLQGLEVKHTDTMNESFFDTSFTSRSPVCSDTGTIVSTVIVRSRVRTPASLKKTSPREGLVHENRIEQIVIVLSLSSL